MVHWIIRLVLQVIRPLDIADWFIRYLDYYRRWWFAIIIIKILETNVGKVTLDSLTIKLPVCIRTFTFQIKVGLFCIDLSYSHFWASSWFWINSCLVSYSFVVCYLLCFLILGKIISFWFFPSTFSVLLFFPVRTLMDYCFLFCYLWVVIRVFIYI